MSCPSCGLPGYASYCPVCAGDWDAALAAGLVEPEPEPEPDHEPELEPEPTREDFCAHYGHPPGYYGAPRCDCGQVRWPRGGARALDLFAGPGGWDVHAEAIGLEVVGVELDDDACATRRAAGLFTVQADVAALRPEALAAVHGPFDGIIASPPCQLFSSAGKGAGRARAVMDELLRGVAAAAAGASDVELARRRHAVRHLLRGYLHELHGYKRARSARKVRGVESEAIRRGELRLEADRMAANVCLVWQPARWVARLRPRWVALEQVPPVLPLWQAMGRALEAQGYRCWAGVLSAERYGVPQTRKRAFLLASLDGQPHPPQPTHQEYVPGQAARPAEPDLFGPGLAPWVSMAEALGWGMTARPTHTVTGGGTSGGGGVEVFASDDVRRVVGREREEGRWVDEVDPDEIEVAPQRGEGMTERHGERRPRKGSEPAPTVRTGSGGGCGTNLLVRQTNSTKGGTRPEGLERTADAPARTVDSRADQWEIVGDAQAKATVRAAHEPAPTIKGGHSNAERRWRLANGTHDDVVLDRRQTDGNGDAAGPRRASEPAPTMSAQGLAKGRDVWRADADDPDATWNRDDLAARKRDPEAARPSHLNAKQAGMVPRSVDDPAPTLLSGKLAKDTPEWVDERPAPTVTGSRRSKYGGLVGRQLPAGEGENVGGHGWTDERPATTVAGDARVFPPGHKINDEDVRAGRGGQQRSGAGYVGDGEDTNRAAAVRVSVAEAAALQSFPLDWPWQGTRTSQFQQVGNAVPPMLAHKVLLSLASPLEAS